jgi:hypothetical protein
MPLGLQELIFATPDDPTDFVDLRNLIHNLHQDISEA